MAGGCREGCSDRGVRGCGKRTVLRRIKPPAGAGANWQATEPIGGRSERRRRRAELWIDVAEAAEKPPHDRRAKVDCLPEVRRSLGLGEVTTVIRRILACRPFTGRFPGPFTAHLTARPASRSKADGIPCGGLVGEARGNLCDLGGTPAGCGPSQRRIEHPPQPGHRRRSRTGRASHHRKDRPDQPARAPCPGQPWGPATERAPESGDSPPLKPQAGRHRMRHAPPALESENSTEISASGEKMPGEFRLAPIPPGRAT